MGSMLGIDFLGDFQIAEKNLVMANVKYNPLTSSDFRKISNRNNFKRRDNKEESVISAQNTTSGIRL